MNETKILLLENVNSLAVEILRAQGHTVHEIKTGLSEDELIEKLKIGKYSGLGIRSKTKVTDRVIKELTGQVRFLFKKV